MISYSPTLNVASCKALHVLLAKIRALIWIVLVSFRGTSYSIAVEAIAPLLKEENVSQGKVGDNFSDEVNIL